MRKLFNTPHPIGFAWSYAIIPALAVLFILSILGPYGFADLSFSQRLQRAFPFFLITALAAPVNLMLANLILPKAMDSSKWTIGKEFIYNVYDIALIGFWNSLLVYFIRTNTNFAQVLFKIGLHTLMVGIIPIIIFIGFKHIRALNKLVTTANLLNDDLHSTIKSQSNQSFISFFTESGKFEIKLAAQRIIFLKSEGNYVEVYYLNEEDKLVKHLIRNRLKVILDVLPKNIFFQCQKSYIINLEKIIKARGNARDLSLSLEGCNQQVPVSRNKTNELLAILNR